MAREDYQPQPQYPDLDRMVQQRRLGYLDEQALLRSLNQQRMLAGQEPARSFDEAFAARPRAVAQTEVAPLQLDPRLFAGRSAPSVESYRPAQDTGFASALAPAGQGTDFGLRQLLQLNQLPPGGVPPPPARPAEAPQAATPQLEQPAQPRSRLPLSQQRQPPVAAGAYPRGANYMTGQPGQNIIPVQTAAGNINAHSAAAPALQGFVNDLVAAGAPVTDVGSYNMRRIAGSSRWSQHAYGNAIDINQTGRNVVTPAFREWASRNPDALRAAQVKWNVRSGGDWTSPDFGHFEWAGPRGAPSAQAPAAPAAVAPAAQLPQQPAAIPMPQPRPVNLHMQRAVEDLKLTPQESALYQRHLDNLWGPGGVTNPDGSRSTLMQIGFDQDGRTYNVPSVYEGKIVQPREAIERARVLGLDTFPSYPSQTEAEDRYHAMHHYMDQDTGDYFARNPTRGL